MSKKFWKTKVLADLSKAEWESLCDGCGICCLNKLEDEESGEFFYTNVACHLMDLKSCSCSKYKNRKRLEPDCIQLDPRVVKESFWLPKSCAYRLLSEGKNLKPWHPLVSGDPQSVYKAGKTLHGKIISEKKISEVELEDYIVDWVKF